MRFFVGKRGVDGWGGGGKRGEGFGSGFGLRIYGDMKEVVERMLLKDC